MGGPPIEKVTLWEDLLCLTLRSESDGGAKEPDP